MFSTYPDYYVLSSKVNNSLKDLEHIQDIDAACDELEKQERYFELELLRYYQLNISPPNKDVLPSKVHIYLKNDHWYDGFDSMCFSAFVPNCGYTYKHFLLARIDYTGAVLYSIIQKTRKKDKYGEVRLRRDYEIFEYRYTDIYHGISVDNRKYGIKKEAINKAKRDLAKFYGWVKPKNYIHTIKGEDE